MLMEPALRTSNATRDCLLDLGEDGWIILKCDLKEYVPGCGLDVPGSVMGSCEHGTAVWSPDKACSFWTHWASVQDSFTRWSRGTTQDCILEVFGSILGRDIGHSEWNFWWFSSVLPEKFRDSTSLRPQQLPSKSFQHPYSTTVLHPTLKASAVHSADTPADTAHVLVDTNKKQTNSMVWVLERTIPTERPPLVGEVIADKRRSLGVVRSRTQATEFSLVLGLSGKM
jgi:hypothetical protein